MNQSRPITAGDDGRLSWMPVFPADELAATAHLSPEQHSAYVRLTYHYWNGAGRLPDDDEQLARLAGLSLRAWRKVRPAVEALFDPGWKHRRLDEALARARENYEKKVRAGSAGGNARIRNFRAAESQKSAVSEQNQSSSACDVLEANGKQTSSLQNQNQKEREVNTSLSKGRGSIYETPPPPRSPGRPADGPAGYDDAGPHSRGPSTDRPVGELLARLDFDQFWSAYPLKIGRKAALRAYLDAREKVSLTVMLAAIERYVATKPQTQQYCYPEKWLSDERWNDERPALQPAGRVASGGAGARRRNSADELDDIIAAAEAGDRAHQWDAELDDGVFRLAN